jgi:DNA-binding Lrp family transcriptional regulator
MQKYKYKLIQWLIMKNREKELLFQLLKNSKLSDREIAKKLQTSQSTITRIRHKLEYKYIKSYTVVPDLAKLGIKIIAFTLGSTNKQTPGLSKKVYDFVAEQPNIVFAGRGEGMGKLGMTISFHRDFTDFMEFMAKTRNTFSEAGINFESFLVSTDNLIQTLIMSKAIEYLVSKE